MLDVLLKLAGSNDERIKAARNFSSRPRSVALYALICLSWRSFIRVQFPWHSSVICWVAGVRSITLPSESYLDSNKLRHDKQISA
jgi:hypothetical protein